MPLGLLSTVLAIFVMALIYAKVCAAPSAASGVLFGLLFGIFAACIHPLSNFVTMNIDIRLGLETTASCLIGWVLVGVTVALLYKPILH